MRRPNRAVVVAAFACCVAPAHALTVRQLDADCRAADSSAGGLVCLGFMRGLVDGMTMMAAADDSKFFCPPKDGLGEDHAKGVVLQYFTDHETDANEEAGAIATIALGKAFSCQRK